MDFRNSWDKSVIRLGRVTVLCAMIASFFPNLFLWIFYGVAPVWTNMLPAWAAVATAYGAFYAEKTHGEVCAVFNVLEESTVAACAAAVNYLKPIYGMFLDTINKLGGHNFNENNQHRNYSYPG